MAFVCLCGFCINCIFYPWPTAIIHLNLPLTENFQHFYNKKRERSFVYFIFRPVLQMMTSPKGGFWRFCQVELTFGYTFVPKIWLSRYTRTHTYVCVRVWYKIHRISPRRGKSCTMVKWERRVEVNFISHKST